MMTGCKKQTRALIFPSLEGVLGGGGTWVRTRRLFDESSGGGREDSNRFSVAARIGRHGMLGK